MPSKTPTLHHTRRWRTLRNRYITANPLCERCKARGFVTPADQVDHRVPHYAAPALFFVWDNLQSLCGNRKTGCHGEKSAEDLLKYRAIVPNNRKGRIGPDIGPDGLPIPPAATGADGLPA